MFYRIFTLVALFACGPAPIEPRAHAAAPSPAVPAASVALWANDGGDKVTRKSLRKSNARTVTNAVWDGTTIKVSGARNEVVGFNLVIEAPTGAQGVGVTFDTLEGPGGAKITSKPTTGLGVFDWRERPIELFLVRYLAIKGLSRLSYETYDERHVPERMRRPFSGAGAGRGPWAGRPDHDAEYPDIAQPLEWAPRFDIEAGHNQSVWVDVYVPKSATPGVYRGVIRVQPGAAGAPIEVPVELLVHGFVLPDVPASATMVVFGYGDVNERYLGERWPNSPRLKEVDDLRDRHFMLAHRHSIALIDSNEGPEVWKEDAPRPAWIPRLDGSLFTAKHGYAGPGEGVGNGVFSIGTYGGWTWKDQDEAAMHTHASNWVRWFDANSPTTEYFLYLIDESNEFAKIERWAQWLDRAPEPGRRLMSMATLPAPEAMAHTPSLDIVTSRLATGPTAPWAAAAKRWREAKDKRFYLYNGVRPGTGSFAIEDDGVALRMLPWAQHKLGVDRWFFWESTYYNDFQGGRGANNVLRDALTFGQPPKDDAILGQTSSTYSNGDGVLFYPGVDTKFPGDAPGVAGPMASLRLKHWRRGIQDVAYLKLAAAKDPELTSAIIRQLVPTVLWECGVTDPKDPTWVRTDIHWTTNPDDWEAARRALAAIIEK